MALSREWAEDLIQNWNRAGWWELSEQFGDQLAPLVGAEPGEVVVCDTTTVNLYKILHAALSESPI